MNIESCFIHYFDEATKYKEKDHPELRNGLFKLLKNDYNAFNKAVNAGILIGVIPVMC
jgi:hypothetical protein